MGLLALCFLCAEEPARSHTPKAEEIMNSRQSKSFQTWTMQGAFLCQVERKNLWRLPICSTEEMCSFCMEKHELLRSSFHTRMDCDLNALSVTSSMCMAFLLSASPKETSVLQKGIYFGMGNNWETRWK